jgi:hypothetical protein
MSLRMSRKSASRKRQSVTCITSAMARAHHMQSITTPLEEDLMTWNSDGKWIVVHSAFATLLVLAWLCIPA